MTAGAAFRQGHADRRASEEWPSVRDMEVSWSLVCPRKRAEALVKAGKLTERSIAGISWRDSIACVLTESELKASAVTIDTVRQAIIHYTATVPSIVPCRVGWRDDLDHGGAAGYLVTAKGYRLGPAGDY